MRKRCKVCGKLTNNWQSVNGSVYHCYDGCYSTLGRDNRTIDGKPAWEKVGKYKPFDPRRMIKQ